MKGKRTTRVTALAVFVVVAVVAAGPGTLSANASPPQQTATFTAVGEFDSPVSEFASDGTVVCASGTTSDEFSGTGWRSGQGIILHDRKTVTCDDGSGTFTLLIQGSTGFNEGEGTLSGRWVVLSGTGDYVHLRGQGTFAGTYTPIGASEFTGVSELYSGWLALG